MLQERKKKKRDRAWGLIVKKVVGHTLHLSNAVKGKEKGRTLNQGGFKRDREGAGRGKLRKGLIFMVSPSKEGALSKTLRKDRTRRGRRTRMAGYRSRGISR